MSETVKLSFDPDGPRRAVEQAAQVLEVLPKARVVLITLIMTADEEFKLPLVLSGERLERIRPVLIERALENHARCEELLALYEQRDQGLPS